MGCLKDEPAGHNVTAGVSCGVCFNPLVWFLWFFDFLIWMIYFLIIGWLFAIISCCRSCRADGKQVTMGSEVTWRQAYADKGEELERAPSKELKTAWDCFDRSFEKFKDQNCMGTRRYLGQWRKEKGHKIVKGVFGKTDWASYKTVGSRAEDFGKGLRALGMTPSKAQSKAEFEASSDPDTLLLWENTCADWMTTAAGAFSQSLVVATSYATLGVEGVLEAVNQCECPVVVCNRTQVGNLIVARAGLAPEAKERFGTIIYTNLNCGGGEAHGYDCEGIDDDFRPNDMAPLTIDDFKDFKGMPEGAFEGLKLMHYEEVIKLGKDYKEKQEKPSRDTMAVVMYTSGSTGKPKGVLIAHKNLCASIAGMATQFNSWGEEGKEVYLAYLPAAHILELVAEIAMISFGAAIGYADPRTIASTGAGRFHKKDGKNCITFTPSLDLAPGAIQEFRPTTMAAVPKIWDILKKAVEAKMEASSCMVRLIFEAAYAAQKNGASWRYCPLLNLFFTKGVGAVVGGRMKCGISGGGPLSKEVQQFCRIAFGFPLIQGYALTETTCAGCVQLTSDSEDGVVGAPISSVEIKLVDCPSVNDRFGNPYLGKDTEHWDKTTCAGRGEVLIRGPSVSMGYYAKGDQAESLIKKTTEEFSNVAPNEDDKNYDWFHTGDIGLFTPDGRLKLIDRKKNLVKLKGGEYIAIEQMEAVYGTSTWVDAKNGGIMVHGDGDMDKPVALIQGNMVALRKWAEENGVSGDDVAICANEKTVKMVLADLLSIGKDKLAINEKLCAIAVISGTGSAVWPGDDKSTWTPENGFLTASNKIDRNAIKHGKEMNGENSPSFAAVLQTLRLKGGGAAGGIV